MKVIHVNFQTKERGSICSCCQNIGVEIVNDLCWDCSIEIATDLENIPVGEEYNQMIEKLSRDIPSIGEL